MCIDSTKGDVLTLCSDIVDEQFVYKPPIVTMIMSDAHPMCLGVILKGVFSLKSLFTICRLLEMDVTEAAEVINKDGSGGVASCGRDPFELSNEAWRGRGHLVHRDALAWRSGNFDFGKWSGC